MATKKKTDEIVEDLPVEDTVEDATESEVDDKEQELLDREYERFLPDPAEPLKLSDGTEVLVRPLKVRGLFAAFKVITRGSAMSFGSLNYAALGEDDSSFASTFVALLINSIPEASFEFAEFLREMVTPVPPKGGWADRDAEKEAEMHLDQILLEDPEIDDAFDIVTAVAYRESRDIERLVKKIQGAMKVFTKVNP